MSIFYIKAVWLSVKKDGTFSTTWLKTQSYFNHKATINSTCIGKEPVQYIDLIYIVYLSQSLMFSHLSIRSILLIVVVLANWNFFDIKDSGDFKRNPRNPWNINQAEDFFFKFEFFVTFLFFFNLNVKEAQKTKKKYTVTS